MCRGKAGGVGDPRPSDRALWVACKHESSKEAEHVTGQLQESVNNTIAGVPVMGGVAGPCATSAPVLVRLLA